MHDQPGAGPGNRHDSGGRNGPQGVRRRTGRSGSAAGRCGRTRALRNQATRTGGHRHGSRRPRQDLVARLHSSRQGCFRRSGWHYAAYWRLPRRYATRHDHLPRHPGSRSVYRDACPWRQGNRHRDSGGCRRRWRDAANERSDCPCESSRRTAGGGDQQGRQTRRQR
ncbi:hypothetical protein D3C72_1564540 [compost metagenome]